MSTKYFVSKRALHCTGKLRRTRDSLIYSGRKGSAVRYRKPDMPPDGVIGRRTKTEVSLPGYAIGEAYIVTTTTFWTAAIWRHERHPREQQFSSDPHRRATERPSAAEHARCTPKCAQGEPDKISAWRCVV
jgi:hypothetical protein